MLLLALALSQVSHAEPHQPYVAGEHVLVHRATWLSTQPDAAAPRLRTTSIVGAPAYVVAPAIAFEVVALHDGGWLEIKTIPKPAPRNPDGRWAAPDAVGSHSMDCYPTPPAIAQVPMTFYIRTTDTLKVIARAFEYTSPGGQNIRFEPGLYAAGRDGHYRIRANHLSIEAAIPDSYIARSWLPNTSPKAQRFTIANATSRVVADPRWQLTFDAMQDDLHWQATQQPPHPGSMQVDVLTDRCITIKFNHAKPMLSPKNAATLADATTWPIVIPADTKLRWGTHDLGTTAYDYVLWNMASCAYSTAHGLCCTPPPGFELSNQDAPICYLADVPQLGANRTIDEVLKENNSDILTRFNTAQTGVPQVSILAIEPRGSAKVANVRQTLANLQGSLQACYEERLMFLDPPQRRLQIDVSITGAARGHVMQAQMTPKPDLAIVDCVSTVLEGARFLTLYGAANASFTLTLDMRIDSHIDQSVAK